MLSIRRLRLGGNHDISHKAPTSTLRYDTAGNIRADVTSVILIYCRIHIEKQHNASLSSFSHITSLHMMQNSDEDLPSIVLASQVFGCENAHNS